MAEKKVTKTTKKTVKKVVAKTSPKKAEVKKTSVSTKVVSEKAKTDTKTEKKISESKPSTKREFRVKVSDIAQSPYKLRLLAGLVRRKKVERALAELEFTNKKGAKFVKKAIESGAANAKSLAGLEKKDLIVKEIMVNESGSLKRWKIASRSRVATITKRRSHLILVLSEK